jgi:hypothetical protein
MAIRLDKAWTALDDVDLRRLPGQLGVYQLADAAGEILYIGAAGGRSLFGLRGEIEQARANPPAGATQFRYEVTMAYRTRHLELLMVFKADHGRLPSANTDVDESRLGRLSPL